MIDRGIRAGEKLGVRGTPAVFLNGWRYPGVPPEADFLQAVDDLVAGKVPFDGFPATAVNAQR
jgi:protein-disulfide isomerase